MALANIGGKAEGTLGKVLSFIVILAVLGGTIGLVFTNLDTVVTEFENFNGTNTTLNAIVPIFGLVVGVLIVIGIVKLTGSGKV